MARVSRGPAAPAIDAADLIALLLIVAAAVWAYYDTFAGPFVFDDRGAIPNNLTIRNLSNLGTVLSPPRNTPVAGRPISNLSFALNYAIGGANVWGYHFVNLGLHVLAAWLLYGVVRRTLLLPRFSEETRADAPWIAAAVAVVWVAHPLQTESVTYMVQRTEVLAGLFFLSTLFCAVRSLDSPHANRWILGAFVSAALGMGSKESMVTAPLLVILYDRVFVFESLETQFRERRTLYAVVCSTWIVLVVLLAGAPRSASVSLSHAEMSPVTYAITQIGVVVHYLRLSLWPDSLVVDYQGWPIARSIRDVLPQALLLAALLAATITALHRRHWLGYAGAWLFVVLAPSSSIVPILTEVVAERRMYLPLAAVVVVCVVGVRWLATSLASRPAQAKAARVAWVTVVVVIAAGLAHASSLRNEDYRSEFAIWSDAVAKRPDNYRARLNLGDYFQTEGKYAEAEEQFSAAVRLSPNTPEARYGLGVALAAQQRSDAAISSYGEALRLDPNYANAHHALGMALVAQGNLDEGIGHYRQALAIKPADSSLRYKLGTALNRQGKTQDAIAEWQEAVRISPGFADAHLVLATALRSTGDVGGARAHAETALKINPNLQAARQLLDEMKASGQ